MILIADSGSTKIDWCLLNGNKKVAQIFTTGMNALLMTEEEMAECIMTELMPNLRFTTMVPALSATRLRIRLSTPSNATCHM